MTLRNERVELRLEPDGQIALEDLLAEGTRLAGGMLIELAPAVGGGAAHTYGTGEHAEEGAVGEAEPFVDSHGSGLRLRRSHAVVLQPLEIASEVRLYDRLNGIRIGMTLRHTGREPLRLERAFPFVAGAWWGNGALEIAGRRSDFAAYKNGWQSWSFAGGLPPGRREPRPHAPTLVAWHHPAGRRVRGPITGEVEIVCDAVGMLGMKGHAEAALAGFLSAERWLGQIYLRRDEAALAACVLLDGHILNPGETLDLPPLWLALGSQRTLLTDYAAMVGSEQGAREPSAPPTGWCSWYYYFDRVAERDITANLGVLAASRSVLPVEILQIDDGYEAAVGDWMETSTRFSHGMGPLAERIREAGFRPGLWLAPFMVASGSRLAREHPEWLIADARGKPAWGGRFSGRMVYGLDTTHPGAQDWLRALFTTITREWGYDYLKLDFLAAAALPGRRYDPLATRARALRAGLALIREVVGDSVYLLGCGCPLLGAVGLVDAMRIGPDSSPYWKAHYGKWPLPSSEGHVAPGMEGALRNTLTRAWMAPALWANDPDCLLARETRTHLTSEEVRAFASAVALTGGLALFSDEVAQLSVGRVELVAALLPPMRERALPTENFAWGVPPVVLAEIARPWEEWVLVGLFNSAGREREVAVTWEELGLAPGRYHAMEYWSGAYLGLSEEGARVRVGRHGAAVLAIHAECEEPRLLATSYHITQGAAEVADWSFDSERAEARWRIHLGRHAIGMCALSMPPGWQPRGLTSTAHAAHWHRDAQGLIRVSAEITDVAEFTLTLEREP